jgi:hypothetical protein
VIRLDAAVVLLQWAAGGMLFAWVTTRHRLIGVGYGWMLRGTYLALALGAAASALAFGSPWLVTASAGLTALACAVALGVSVARKDAGVSGQRAEHDRRTARVAAMTGIERAGDTADGGGPLPAPGATTPEYDPRLDLLAPAFAVVGLVVGAVDAGGPAWLSVLRVLVGAAFLGAITDAMLLGHWYLVQPGLPRTLLHELVDWNLRLWPVEVLVFLPSPGMIEVLTGSIDDGWNGLLGWTWVVCALTTVGLLVVTKAALKERQYSAVMAATGLLYLAILTAFGTDLIARAVLA